MASIFSKIISGEIPAYKVAENENFLAFLEIMPISKGHLLVIPKKEVDYIFDIDDENYVEMFLFAKEVAKKQKNAIPCKKIGIAVIGLDVAHTHIHLIPIHTVSDMNFSKPKLKFSKQEFEEVAELIKNA